MTTHLRQLEDLGEQIAGTLQRLDAISERYTVATELLAGMSINNVLFSGTLALDATGTTQVPFRVPFGSMAITVPGTSVTVHSSGLGSGAPAQGRGVRIVGAGTFQVFNLAGTDLSIYGTGGQVIGLEVFSNASSPAASKIGPYVVTAENVPGAIANGVSATGAGIPATGASRFRAMIFADQPGNLLIQQSRDGVTWRTTVGPQATVASTGSVIESIVTRAWVRGLWTNTSGGASTTVCELDTALVA